MTRPPELTLAARTQKVLPSATLAMAARASAMQAAGGDILSMSAGEPDFDTPAPIRTAAAAAMAQGDSKYTPVAGSRAMRQAIVAACQRTYGWQVTAAQVICGTGGKQVLFNAVAALCNPGDEVVMAAPYWVSYPDMVRLFDGVPVFVAPEPGRALPSAGDFARHLGPASRLLILNSPSNPAGATYSAEDLAGIAQLVRQHPNLVVISDDIYSGLVYDAPFVSIAHVAPDLAPRLLIASGVSKTYAMTGWRIGYGIGPAPLIQAMANLQGASTSGACSIAQAAAVHALGDDQSDALHMAATFARRRDRMLQGLGKIDGLTFTRPQGAFYVMAHVETFLHPAVPTSALLCDFLLDAVGLAAVPGSAFGSEGSIRLSFACSEAHIDEGLQRLATGLARCRSRARSRA